MKSPAEEGPDILEACARKFFIGPHVSLAQKFAIPAMSAFPPRLRNTG